MNFTNSRADCFAIWDCRELLKPCMHALPTALARLRFIRSVYRQQRRRLQRQSSLWKSRSSRAQTWRGHKTLIKQKIRKHAKQCLVRQLYEDKFRIPHYQINCNLYQRAISDNVLDSFCRKLVARKKEREENRVRKKSRERNSAECKQTSRRYEDESSIANKTEMKQRVWEKLRKKRDWFTSVYPAVRISPPPSGIQPANLLISLQKSSRIFPRENSGMCDKANSRAARGRVLSALLKSPYFPSTNTVTFYASELSMQTLSTFYL